MELFGRAYDAAARTQYFGDPSVLAGVRRYTLREGSAAGCKITQIKTGSGLSFEVNESRGMDIGRVEFQGIPISYASYVGEVHPKYRELVADGWLRSFAGGLLVTGGLASMGSPEIDKDEMLPLHGRISHIPAERVAVVEDWDAGGTRIFSVSGVIREAKALGYHLQLQRTIQARENSNTITIRDRVQNVGWSPCEWMLLYHMNLGHPILDEGARLLAHSKTVFPRDEIASARTEPHNEYLAPTPGYQDVVYYHDIEDQEGHVNLALVNEKIGMGLALSYEKELLSCFTQWKFLAQGNYVAGIEPGTAFVGGRSAERQAGRVHTLEPQEFKDIEVEITILSTPDGLLVYKQKHGF
ncbi:aldose 1-epimerase family protein [Collinsella sp. AGMB00827]|uniref:Aldose 1-epimerase family protein n=1 Tax=Collinsella ureilytica TaxID=2869515 RepID=A0ABS7MJX8_9ACTN|nr:aldose 1-epimerase family protein [Collinsella urealyticum]MBY4797669.1 aldose 1-epimerase family protein [Collinsella urealyticum]